MQKVQYLIQKIQNPVIWRQSSRRNLVLENSKLGSNSLTVCYLNLGYNTINSIICNTMFLTTTFIVIMIYVHHVFAMNTVYERWSLLGEIPRQRGNKVKKKDIRHLIYYRHFYFGFQQHNISSYKVIKIQKYNQNEIIIQEFRTNIDFSKTKFVSWIDSDLR